MASYINRLFNTPFFQNKAVLYASLLLVLLSILRHISNSNTNAVILMALIGLLTSYFSKNMIVILLTAFATVFVFEMIGSPGVMEGMKGKKEKENVDTLKSSDEMSDDDDKEALKEGSKTQKKPETKKPETKKPATKKPATKKPETKKPKQGMATLTPASYDGKDHDGDGDDDGGNEPNGANRIDYASTLEQAYDNIENIIGEEGVRGLTDQTKSLMNQQKELMNSMKDMGPLLQSAEGFMKQITGDGGLKGVTDMLKGFVSPASSKK
jgi:hypothetical protein